MTQLKILFLSYLAKTLAYISKLLGKGSGTALPGLIVEQKFIEILEPLGKQFEEIIFISGTNGKTTTRAILVDIYEQNGVAVCTNRGGANILRGIASTLLLNLDNRGKSKAKVAILEVEEASMPKLAKYIAPDTVILTNIFRDQLDAYGEIDQTIGYFKQALALAQTKKTVKLYINSDDQKLLTAAKDFKGEIYGFGLNLPATKKPDFEQDADQVVDFTGQFTAYSVKTNSFQVVTSDNVIHKLSTRLPGVYNLYNVLVAFVVGYEKFGASTINPVVNFQPVFGRGEDIMLPNGRKLQLFLIKNPAGFNLVLDWIADTFSTDYAINLAIAINDNIADGRDVSWLWDADLETFVSTQRLNKIFTAGTRAEDMLLRLQYAGAKVRPGENMNNLETLFQQILETDQDFLVLCTYTALMDFRKLLSKTIELAQITQQGN
jgi:UDP-N-acetylmuramyl tripeptide synthase